MPTQTNIWNVNADGDWSVAADWSLGFVPNSSNDVVINTANVHTITHSTGNDVVNSITVGQDHFILSGGALEILTTASFADGFTQTGGTLLAGNVTITGPGTLTGGSATGSTAFTINGAIALAGYLLGGGAVLNNASATNQTGGLTLGDNTGVNATINNQLGGTYAIHGDYGIGGGAASAQFVNAGKLVKAAGVRTSFIDVSLASTGRISSVVGNLEFRGPSNSVSGIVTGAGQISFGGSSATVLNVGTVSVGTLGLYDAATLTFAGAATTLTGALNDVSSGNNTLNLGGGTLTLNGAATFAGLFATAFVTGTGALILNGAATGSGAQFGGSATVTNNGSFNETGYVQIGDGSGSAAHMVNSAAASYALTTDSGVARGSNTASDFTNAGVFAKTAGTGTSDVAVSFVNQSTGTINAATTGAITFSNSLANAGTIAGTGQVALINSGSATLNAGSVLSVAHFGLYNNGLLSLGASVTYNQLFTDNSTFSNTTIALGANSFTLGGVGTSITGAFGTAFVTGSGTLANAATGSLTVGGMLIGGSATLANSGAISETGAVQIGDASGSVAHIANLAGASYALITDSGIGRGTSATSDFTNAGVFAKTGGTGASDVAASFVNQSTGTINAATTGTVTFSNSLANAGKIAGVGQVAIINGGTATLNTGSVLSVAHFGLYNASLNLGTSVTYNKLFTDNSSFGNTTIALNARTLTLGGAGNSITGAFGTAFVTGSGTLANAATGSLTVSQALLGGTATLANSGTVNETGAFSVGDSGGAVARVANLVGATWTVANGATLSNGSAAASHFDNSGIFTVAANGGGATVNTVFNNNTGATMNIASGTLGSQGILVNAGTIAGAALNLTGSSQTMLNAGTSLSVAAIGLLGSSTLTLGTNVSYGHTFNDNSFGNSTIDLTTHNLTLNGPASFLGGFGAAVVTGSGTLFTQGTATLAAVLLASTASMNNTGTISASGNLQIGDGSGNAAHMVNGAGGIYDLVNDFGIGHGSSLLSSFTNNGLFEKTAGTGISVVQAPFVNNGTITVNTGTIEFTAGSLTNNGAINGVVTTDGFGNTFVGHI